MRIKPGYILRQVMDVHVVIGIGSDAYRPNQIMSVNDTGAFLWHMLEKGAERTDLIDTLTAEYDVDAETAGKDVDVFLNLLREKALLDDA